MQQRVDNVVVPLHRVAVKPYTIIHYDQNQTFLDVKSVEETYSKKGKCEVKYIGEFTLKNIDGAWANTPVSVFWQETIPEQYKDIGSNWFGIYLPPGKGLMITNAKSAVDHIWTGILNEKTNEVLYSAYRHDYQVHGDLMADGGADYVRSSNHPKVKFKIVRDSLEIVV